MARLLIVEDDDHIRGALQLLFEAQGFDVLAQANGEAALASFEASPADAVLVDVMLPTMSGFETCRALRQRSDVPILIVSARDETPNVVEGLEAGADDYITKPFVPAELVARVNAHLRRRPQKNSREFALGAFRVIPDEGVVRKADGSELHLTATEFRLLLHLASAHPQPLSREELLDQVWGYDYFGDSRLVDVHVRRLRTKIESDPATPLHLITVRGAGYKLVL